LIDLPPKTATYCPIGHEPFVELVEKKMADIGYFFGTQAHALTKAGARYFGLVELINENAANDDGDHALVLGLRNSIDKSFPAKLAWGSQVFVCDNLCFSGEIMVSRKHTTHIMRDLPKLIEGAVAHTRLMAENQEARFACYKETKLTNMRAEHIIIEMLRRGAVNTSRIQAVVNEWDEPSHDFGPKTAWRLHNATTEALKGAPLHQMPQRTIVLNALLDQVAGFVPKDPANDVIDGEIVVDRQVVRAAA
jgi:hypothetical protein